MNIYFPEIRVSEMGKLRSEGIDIDRVLIFLKGAN
jgi:hypothetical protein